MLDLLIDLFHNLIIRLITSNARPGTRSALSRRDGIFELSTDYLLIQFQKAKYTNGTFFT